MTRHIRLSGYQPQYFPRLHYFARMLDSDIFVIADTYQYVRAHSYPTPDGGTRRDKSYQADTPIKSGTGTQLLTVPVCHKGRLPIADTEIAYNSNWQSDHLKTISIYYSPCPHFRMLFPSIEELINHQFPSLAELTSSTTLWALRWILTGKAHSLSEYSLDAVNNLLKQPHPYRLRKVVPRSSITESLNYNCKDATDTIIVNCKLFDADEYYCGGTAATAYLDVDRLKNEGIATTVQQWVLPPYKQRFMKVGFIPNLSIIDLVMNEEPATVRRLLQTTEAVTVP